MNNYEKGGFDSKEALEEFFSEFEDPQSIGLKKIGGSNLELIKNIKDQYIEKLSALGISMANLQKKLNERDDEALTQEMDIIYQDWEKLYSVYLTLEKHIEFPKEIRN